MGSSTLDRDAWHMPCILTSVVSTSIAEFDEPRIPNLHFHALIFIFFSFLFLFRLRFLYSNSGICLSASFKLRDSGLCSMHILPRCIALRVTLKGLVP